MKKIEFINLTKMIYIASAYTCKHSKDKDIKEEIELERYLLITKVIGRLQDKYPYAFIGPITQSHNTAQYMKKPSTLFKAWKLIDVTYLSHCDEIWIYKDLFKAYKESVGVQEEIKYATLLDIPIKYINYKTLKITNK